MIVNDCTVGLLRKWTISRECGRCKECALNTNFSSVFLVLYWPEFVCIPPYLTSKDSTLCPQNVFVFFV